MKKLYILILLGVCSFFAKAQYTITSSSNPIVGDIQSYFDLDTTGLFFGSSGPSQTWNYSALMTAGNPVKSFTYVPMSSVPNNFLFPGATIADDDGAGNYGVYSNNSTKFEYYGFATATATNCWIYSDPLKLYSIPFTYGTTSPDVFQATQPNYSVTGTFTTYGDGAGTLQLPAGNYSNVLKLNFVVYETDSTPSSVQNYTILINQYYSAVSKFPLLEVQTFNISTITGTTTSTSYAKYGRIISTGISTGIPNKENDLNFGVFPNPVSNGELFISNTPSLGKITIEIFNVLGQQVKTISFESQSGSGSKKVDVSDLTKGIYYLRITGKERTETKKILIE